MPRDPADELASALLERIAAERGQGGARGRARGDAARRAGGGGGCGEAAAGARPTIEMGEAS